jgi:hypothetical protein
LVQLLLLAVVVAHMKELVAMVVLVVALAAQEVLDLQVDREILHR